MTGLAIALGTLLVAVIEVVVLVALLLVLTAAIYGLTVGVRRRHSNATPTRLGAVGVPRQLGERRHGSRVATFDGKPICDRLDVPGCDR